MKLILEIHTLSGEGHITHHIINSFPATVGRGYDNDIILPDPYIHAHQLRIDLNDAALNVFDISGETRLIAIGDVLKIGHTEIRFYAPEHPVPAAITLQKINPIFSWLSQSSTVWGSSIGMVLMATGWAYLGMQIKESEVPITLTAVAAGIMVVTILWAAIWAAAGRVIKHKANFRSHISVINLFVIATFITMVLTSYIDFLLNENMVAAAVSYLNAAVLFAFLLYASLSIATTMPRSRRRTSAVLFSIGAMAGIVAIGFVGGKSFNQMPLYAITLKPYLSSLAPAVTIDRFIEENAAVFEDDLFKEDSDK
jgi:hypothetical protein